jgi:very-short-patch-repair endonuclease
LLIFRRGTQPILDDPERIVARMQTLKRELAALPIDLTVEELDALAEKIALKIPPLLKGNAVRRTTPDRTDGELIADRLKEIDFNKKTKVPQIAAEDARLVLRYRPIWAISTLSVSSRVPLVPALFDYVIFDEASQCDIASAIPLFGRARKAVVVGDPMQLGFIPQLSNRQEHALMDAAGLGTAGRHSIAQSNNSLFDFIRQRGSAQWHFLADQFRSAPDIVGYLNEEFYQGRLVASQDERKARWPDGYKPGLAWHDVRGRATREDGGNVNHAEAEAIVQTLTAMIRERHFTGSIGVLSPFNTQVALLMRRIRAALTEAECAAVELRVSTIDKFQGGEADVILFSLVISEGAHPAALTFYDRERRRLNVAISRARALCVVFGDKAYVQRSRVKALAFLAEASERGPRPRAPFDSEWERLLYVALKGRGLEPFPQYPVGSRYLDFAIDPEGRKLDVEVDGRRWHADPDGNRKVSDRLRDRELIARGWAVRRFWVHELAEDMEKCLGLIERDLNGK